MKRNNIKKLIKFIGTYFLIGAVIGVIIGFVDWDILEQMDLLFIKTLFVGKIAPILSVVTGLSGLVIGFFIYQKAKKDLVHCNEDDLIEIEKKLDYATIFVSIATLLPMIFYAIFIQGVIHNITYPNILLLSSIWLLICGAFSILLQKKIVELVKEINPEKQGDPLEKNFSKQWLESCDEMQKNLIYEVGYRSFTFSLSVTIVTLVILCFIGLIIDIGLLPVIIVSILLVLQIFSYYFFAIKLEYKRKS